MSVFRPSPIPSGENVDATTVAIGANIQLKRVSQAQKSAAGQLGARRTIKSSTFLSSTDTSILADTTASPISLRLTLCSEYSTINFLARRSAGANTFTLTPRGADTINSGASLAVTAMVRVEVDPSNKTNFLAVVIA